MTSQIHDWIVGINEKLSNMESITKKEATNVSRKRSKGIIYRVDDTVRENFCESDYAPHIVSFGPYYHGHKSCMRTEQMKENVLLYFLKKSYTSLDDYIKVLEGEVQNLKKKYGELDQEWQQDDDAFLRLMILDGCFLLEVAREACKSVEADRSDRHFESDNPIWRIDGLSIKELRLRYIHDMLLLENQIPTMVLYKLCGLEINDYWEAIKQVNSYIHRLPSPFPWATKKVRLGREHVLDLYWDNLLCGGYTQLISCFSSDYFKTTSTTEFLFNIPSAIELKEVGIGITTSKTMTLMDVSFSGGTLRLPQISVDRSTKSIFLNIIAYERFHPDNIEKEVTSYIYFMSRLLRDVDDVKLLEARGIIHSVLSCKEIIGMFDSLTVEDIIHDPDIFLVSNYKSIGRNMRKSYNKMSSEWRKDLWKNYLRSPFGIVSVIVAFLLFALTAIQTVYTVLGYYKSK